VVAKLIFENKATIKGTRIPALNDFIGFNPKNFNFENFAPLLNQYLSIVHILKLILAPCSLAAFLFAIK